jgi:hypothetical protein
MMVTLGGLKVKEGKLFYPKIEQKISFRFHFCYTSPIALDNPLPLSSTKVMQKNDLQQEKHNFPVLIREKYKCDNNLY